MNPEVNKFMMLNARSIKMVTSNSNQLQMYHNLILLEKTLFFGIVETWLNDEVSDEELQVKNYLLYRKDRKSRRGGLLLNINNEITSKILWNLECDSNNFNEIIICEFIYYLILNTAVCYSVMLSTI